MCYLFTFPSFRIHLLWDKASKVVSRVQRSDGPNGPPKSLGDLPGPFQLPYFGSSWLYWPMGPYNRHTFHQADVDLYGKYGTIYQEKRQGVSLVSIHRAEDIQKVFKLEGPRPLRVINEALVYCRRKKPDTYPTVGLSESTDEEWYSLRKKVSPVLLRTNNIVDSLSAVDSAAVDLVQRLKETVDKNGNLLQNFGEWTIKYGGEAIWRSVLGSSLGSLDTVPSSEALHLSQLAKKQFNLMAEIRLGSQLWKKWPEIFPKYRQFASLDQEVYEFAEKFIKDAFEKMDHKKSDGEGTILEKFAGVDTLDRRDATTVIVDMFSAGVTTTAVSLLLLLHRLGQEPRVVKRLQMELDEVLPSKDTPITQEILKRMPYLRATITESYRLTPIIPSLIRILPVDVNVGGYCIPKATPILAKTRAACLDDNNFSRSKEFIPERWCPEDMIKDADTMKLKEESKKQRFLVKPFGYGARTCVGMRLAEYELYVAVARILKNFDISSEGDIKLGNFLFLAPLHPVSLSLKTR